MNITNHTPFVSFDQAKTTAGSFGFVLRDETSSPAGLFCLFETDHPKDNQPILSTDNIAELHAFFVGYCRHRDEVEADRLDFKYELLESDVATQARTIGLFLVPRPAANNYTLCTYDQEAQRLEIVIACDTLQQASDFVDGYKAGRTAGSNLTWKIARQRVKKLLSDF